MMVGEKKPHRVGLSLGIMGYHRAEHASHSREIVEGPLESSTFEMRPSLENSELQLKRSTEKNINSIML